MMKIKTNDRLETSHTVIAGIDEETLTAQEGLTIGNPVSRRVLGRESQHYQLHMAKGAILTVPDSLGKRLVEQKHASTVK